MSRRSPTIRALATWLAVSVLAAGCAHRSALPAGVPGQDAGRVVVQLSQPLSGATVMVNGQVVLEGAYTDEVVVDGVPPGRAEIVVLLDGQRSAARVDVAAGGEVSREIDVPVSISKVSLLVALGLSIAGLIAYFSVRLPPAAK